MVSRTKLKQRLSRKTSPELKQTIAEALKNPNWNEVSKLISSSARKQSSLNLYEIDKQVSHGDTVLIAGKVLSKGELTKQVDIVALAISQPALNKLKDSKSKFRTILEEIKSNKKAEGLNILR
jgi:ribosomal protein L18E